MTTIHANSCRDALARLEQMLGLAGLDLPARGMRAHIASAVHVVIQLERMSDGRRRLMSLSEITGLEGEVISMHEIFRFVRRRTGRDGSIEGAFTATGIRPRFAQDFDSRGIDVAADMFEPNRPLV